MFRIVSGVVSGSGFCELLLIVKIPQYAWQAVELSYYSDAAIQTDIQSKTHKGSGFFLGNALKPLCGNCFLHCSQIQEETPHLLQCQVGR